MEKDDIHNLIIKELTSGISGDEKRSLKEELTNDSILNERFLSFENYWRLYHQKNVQHNIVDITERKLGFAEQKERKVRINFILKIVASIILIVSLGYSTYHILKPKQIIILNEYSCSAGEIKEIILSDGTTVWLNSKSFLIASEPFVGKTREVKLFGEAYFEVAHNEEQPFIVKTPELETEVLGTHFDIVAYPTDEVHEISLHEGKIQLDAKNSKTAKVILSPGQRAYFTTETGKIKVIGTDLGQPAKWRDGILRFYDEDLFSITKKLERKFLTRIFISDSVVGNLKFSAEFDVESLETILSLLNKAHKFNYKKMENGIIIQSKKI